MRQAMGRFRVIGAWVMGFLMTSSTAGAVSAIDSELAYLMRDEGFRKPIVLNQRPDLKSLAKQAHEKADALQAVCDVETLSEIRLRKADLEVIAGFEAIAVCEELPAPVGIYFDIHQRFAGLLPILD